MCFGRTTNFLKNASVRGAIALAGLSGSVLRAVADAGDDDLDDYDALPGRTSEQIDALIFNFDEVVETIAFYASLMSVLLILLALSLSLRLKSWAAYVLLTIASIVWFAFFEQYVTAQFWIGLNVGLNALVVAGFALTSLHFLLAGASISQGRQLSWMRPVLFLAAGLIWIVPVMNWADLGGKPQTLFYGIAILAGLSHAAVIPNYVTIKSPSARVKRNGLAFAFTIALAGIAVLVFGELEEEFDIVFIARIAILAVVGFFALFFIRHVLSILRERDATIRQSLEDARRDAEKTHALLEAEKKYTRAKEAARMHTMRLATASHDIRQPIASLRTTMAAVAKDEKPEVRDQLKAAFDYLDELAKSYLDIGEAENAPDSPANANGEEIVSSEIICATLDKMFRKEAEAKNLAFKVETHDANLRIQPLVVTRILSNLLSNAIKHTDEGKVELRAEPEQDGFRFSVFNSANMPGGAETETLFDPFVKGQKSSGTGLGLSIVENLANSGGLRTSWSSLPGEGTTFSLLVPNKHILRDDNTMN